MGSKRLNRGRFSALGTCHWQRDPAVPPWILTLSYYELSLQPELFQEWSLTRAWGRMGTKGCGKTVWFSSREQAEQFYERKRREKLRRGYLPTLFPISSYYHIQAPDRQKTKQESHIPSKKPIRARRASLGAARAV